MNIVLEEWQDLNKEYKQLESSNVHYLKNLQELVSMQEKCKKDIAHQRYRIKSINKLLKSVPDSDKLQELKENIEKRKAELTDIEQTLPRQSDRVLLKLILGDIDVSFLSKEQSFNYKNAYENFKLLTNCIEVFLAFLLLHVNFRPLEQLYLGFLVWYYCTISIRESILKVNGSKIKGWWRVHHLLSILCSCLFLIWPQNEPWTLFRQQFIWYGIYSGFIHFLQYKYQRGTMYRLKALGEMKNIDITLDGFQYWMWKGLAFLLPFVFLGHLFQLVNAIVLYRLSFHPQASWEISALSFLFFVFFLGNFITTIRVIPNKTKRKLMLKYKVLRRRFYDNKGSEHKE